MTARMDIPELLNLVDTFHDSGLATVEVEVGSVRLSLRAEGQAARADAPAQCTAGASTPGAGATDTPEPGHANQVVTVTAPVLGMVGTAGAAAGVGPGSRVAANQVVATLEVRGRRVHVPAPVAGTVARMLLLPGALAEYGAPLMEIKLDGTGGSGVGR